MTDLVKLAYQLLAQAWKLRKLREQKAGLIVEISAKNAALSGVKTDIAEQEADVRATVAHLAAEVL